MTILLTAAIATLAGLTWNWTTDNQPMTYWLMGAFFIGSSVAADLLDRLWERWRLRHRAARRAHARPHHTGRTTP